MLKVECLGSVRSQLWCRRVRPPHQSVLRSAHRRSLHVFIVAGEASGDVLGGALMRALRKQSPKSVRFSGVGGASMKEEGLNELFPMSDLAVMGLVEIIPHLPRLWRRLRDTEEAVKNSKPDILITIDFKGFNFRLLKSLTRSSMSTTLSSRGPDDVAIRPFTTVHYVGPSVWAYKRDSSKTITFLRNHLDALLVLFPFETPHFSAHLPTTCTGAPIFELAAVRDLVKGVCTDTSSFKGGCADTSSFKGVCTDTSSSSSPIEGVCASAAPLGFTEKGVPVEEGVVRLLLLPGSRKQEILKHLPLMMEAIDLVEKIYPNKLHITTMTMEYLKEYVEHCLSSHHRPHITVHVAQTVEERHAVFKKSQVAVCVSGSVTMELCAEGVTSVIVYKAHWLTEIIARRIAAVQHVGLPNLLVGKTIIPELLFSKCTANNIATALQKLLCDPAAVEAQRKGLLEALRLAHPGVGDGDIASPSDIAAKAILEAHAKRASASHTEGRL